MNKILTPSAPDLLQRDVDDGPGLHVAVGPRGVLRAHASEGAVGVDALAAVEAGVLGALVDVDVAVGPDEAAALADGPGDALLAAAAVKARVGVAVHVLAPGPEGRECQSLATRHLYLILDCFFIRAATVLQKYVIESEI